MRVFCFIGQSWEMAGTVCPHEVCSPWVIPAGFNDRDRCPDCYRGMLADVHPFGPAASGQLLVWVAARDAVAAGRVVEDEPLVGAVVAGVVPPAGVAVRDAVAAGAAVAGEVLAGPGPAACLLVRDWSDRAEGSWCGPAYLWRGDWRREAAHWVEPRPEPN